jgi:hypothetical protein
VLDHEKTRRAFVGTAVGVAVGWTAPLIVSSVALADAGTPKCRPNLAALSLTLLTVRFNSMGDEAVPRTTATISGASTVCPCTGAAPTISIRWNSTGGGNLSRRGVLYTAGTYQTFSAAAGGTNEIDVSNDPSDTGNGVNDDLEITGPFTVTATVRWRCGGKGPIQADACASRTSSFSWDGTAVLFDNFTSGPSYGAITKGTC